ncbi:hypothetical protein GGR57DRAFT_498393 [Xylariaceae sp. FL1272]|nr:hypothetical protein GGR57DRAFT_498393 [Xylariaceae sp. FL1272]
MPVINGIKVAWFVTSIILISADLLSALFSFSCNLHTIIIFTAPCIRGHRATSCDHANERIMVPVRKPGRPLSSCPHRPGTNCQCSQVTVTIPRKRRCGAFTGCSSERKPGNCQEPRNDTTATPSSVPEPMRPISSMHMVPENHATTFSSPIQGYASQQIYSPVLNGATSPVLKQHIDKPVQSPVLGVEHLTLQPSQGWQALEENSNFISGPHPISNGVNHADSPSEAWVTVSMNFEQSNPSPGHNMLGSNPSSCLPHMSEWPAHSYPKEYMPTYVNPIPYGVPGFTPNGFHALNDPKSFYMPDQFALPDGPVISETSSSTSPSLPPSSSSGSACCSQLLPPSLVHPPHGNPVIAKDSHPTTQPLPTSASKGGCCSPPPTPPPTYAPTDDSAVQSIEPDKLQQSNGSHSVYVILPHSTTPEPNIPPPKNPIHGLMRNSDLEPLYPPNFGDEQLNVDNFDVFECICGPDCECLGCLAHPFNHTTQEYVMSAYKDLAQTPSPSGEQYNEHENGSQTRNSTCCSKSS